MHDNYLSDVSPSTDYSSDRDSVGIVTAVEQTTGSKQGLFKGVGRNMSVSTYQWLIVVGALAALWALGFNLRSLRK